MSWENSEEDYEGRSLTLNDMSEHYFTDSQIKRRIFDFNDDTETIEFISGNKFWKPRSAKRWIQIYHEEIEGGKFIEELRSL